MAKLKFQQALRQSSEIILICRLGAQERFVIINEENSYAELINNCHF